MSDKDTNLYFYNPPHSYTHTIYIGMKDVITKYKGLMPEVGLFAE